MSSISISKWWQDLEMDSQLRSSTILDNLHEGLDEDHEAYNKVSYN
jgi:formiminotetrahydrofolate cyclodeaminase